LRHFHLEGVGLWLETASLERIHHDIDALEQTSVGRVVFIEEFTTDFKGSATSRHQIVRGRWIFKEKGQEFFVFFAIDTEIGKETTIKLLDLFGIKGGSV
jgi:hypothetical protein